MGLWVYSARYEYRHIHPFRTAYAVFFLENHINHHVTSGTQRKVFRSVQRSIAEGGIEVVGEGLIGFSGF